MSEETIYWIFSTIPQVIAALTGLSLTAITFLFSNLNDEVQKDKTLTEIIGKVEKKIHTETTYLIIWSLLAIAVDVAVLYFTEELGRFLTNSINESAFETFMVCLALIAVVIVNIVPFLSLYQLLTQILDPEFKDSIIKGMAQDENKGQKETRTAEPMEFMDYFRLFEKKTRELYSSFAFDSRESILTLSKILKNDHVITDKEYAQLMKIIKMRNIFIHGGDIEKVDYFLIDILENVTEKIETEILSRKIKTPMSPRDRVFANWIENNVEDLTEAYELRQAILFHDRYGQYNAALDNGVLYVSSYDGRPLRINSDKAKEDFLSMLDKKFGTGGLGVEDSYNFNRSLEKND